MKNAITLLLTKHYQKIDETKDKTYPNKKSVKKNIKR